jgi:putative glutamine amidotransferase
MSQARPIIGVSGPDRGGDAAWLCAWMMISLAGGRALRVTPHRHAKPHLLDQLDGLIVGGGADINPTLYGEELLHLTEHRRPDQPRSHWLLNLILLPLLWLLRKGAACCTSGAGRDAERDALEMDLIDRAVQRRLPILGICRGMQLLNIYFGGSLHQSLRGLYVEDPEIRTILPRKRLVIPPEAKLARILGKTSLRVNALHNQAIDRLGRALRIAARDRNGIAQAIEHETLPLVLGVQWHPEFLPQLPRQRRIFQALINEARSRSRHADLFPRLANKAA